MDLKNILAKNQKKIKNTDSISVLKNLNIAIDDRPYSVPTNTPISKSKKISTQKKIEQKTGNNLVINRQQTDNKSITKRQQTDNKPTTNQKQYSDYISTNRQQTDNQTGNIIDNKPTTNWQQTDNKLATNIKFSELVGLQRKIVILLAYECKNLRSKITDAITLEHIASTLNHSSGVVKTTLQRLEKKGIIIRANFKIGRGGWSRYELPDHIYHDALRSETGNKSITNWQQIDNKPTTKLATESATHDSSSSSNIINITTTELLDPWNFDIKNYECFGLMRTHLRQLASSGNIDAKDVEQSLIEFSFDYDNNKLPTIKTSKINFLMGLFRAGHSYVSESYRNEQDAIIAEMAKKAEARRKKLLEEKFFAWEANLNDEDRKNIVSKFPGHITVFYRTYGIDNPEVKKYMMEYFVNLKNQK